MSGRTEAAINLNEVEAVIALAAERAEAARTVRRAVRVAWGTLHSQGVGVMGGAFARWAVHEGVRHPADLGGVLRRRYDAPSQVAQSLRDVCHNRGEI